MLLRLACCRAKVFQSPTVSLLRRRSAASMHMQASGEDNISSGKSSQGTIDLSLHRITELLVRLSNPQARFPIIHVAGTNSKGSTIAYLSSLLNHAAGIKAASFTSPHLIFERDCCKVGGTQQGQLIDEGIWDEAGQKVREADSASSFADTSSGEGGRSNGTVGPLRSSPFELLTARCFVALDMLAPADRPEVLLVEVGMGGALDATNVFHPSQVLASVICPIDFDHQSFLGTTLAQIAEHKAGIIKQGGLCILADQRRQYVPASSRGSEETDTIDCTRVRAVRGAGEEEQAFEVQNTIRQRCIAQGARMVKAYVPWEALASSPLSLEGDNQQQSLSKYPWSIYSTSNVRFTPVLAPSKIHQGDFVSATGDPIVPGPSLQLPLTRAALTGCHLALQTLWSIARDETPCALGQAGSDANEELRLRIAFALRDDPAASHALQMSIEEKTRIPGRAEWVNLNLLNPSSTTSSEMDIDKNEEEQRLALPSQLHALVDGAHNASAATALQQYVDSCIRQMFTTQTITHLTITWILAFSRGKDIQEILSNLFGKTDSSSRVEALAERMSSTRLNLHVSQKVACLSFTTPVEGMPWVSSVPAEELSAAVDTAAAGVIDEIKPFHCLQDALQWAAIDGDGKTITDEGRINLVVIAGSLYLVSDVHRLLAAASAATSIENTMHI